MSDADIAERGQRIGVELWKQAMSYETDPQSLLVALWYCISMHYAGGVFAGMISRGDVGERILGHAEDVVNIVHRMTFVEKTH